MSQSHELLVPLVNAPHQRAAVEHAVEATQPEDVTVLNVVTPLDEPFSEGRVLPVTEERREVARARARRLLEEASETDDEAASETDDQSDQTTVGPRWSSVDIAVTEGRPARTVVDEASAREMDRIVVGGRDRTSLSTLLFGRSLAATIDDLSDVPVTVVDDRADMPGQ